MNCISTNSLVLKLLCIAIGVFFLSRFAIYYSEIKRLNPNYKLVPLYKAYWPIRLFISILFITAAFSCFYFPYQKEVEEKNDSGSTIKRSFYHSRQYGAEVFGTGLLLLTILLWRRELGINSAGPFVGDISDAFEGTKNASEDIEVDIDASEAPLKPRSTPPSDKYSESLKNSLLDFVKKKRYVSEPRLIDEFNLSRDNLRKLVLDLGKSIELSEFKNKVLYIDSEFYESKAIDFIKNKLILSGESIRSVYKFVRLWDLELDAVIETTEHLYLIEIKSSVHGAAIFRKRIKDKYHTIPKVRDGKAVAVIMGYVCEKGKGLGSDLYSLDFPFFTTIDIPRQDL